MQTRGEAPSADLVRYRNGRNVHVIELPSNLGSLSTMRSFVDALDLSGVLPAERIFDLKVAISEAAANAIEHAKAKAKIGLWILDDRVVADISNIGEFKSLLDEPWVGRKRGFGLKLMVCLADEVTFRRQSEGATNVTLTFLRSGHRVSSLPTGHEGTDVPEPPGS